MTPTQNRFLGGMAEGYLDCALWSSTDETGEPLDGLGLEVSEDTRLEMRDDCESFMLANWADIEETGASSTQTGHDFWLTRNRHGAGFWDRGYGPVGQRLTSAAYVYGEVNLWVNGDEITAD